MSARFEYRESSISAPRHGKEVHFQFDRKQQHQQIKIITKTHNDKNKITEKWQNKEKLNSSVKYMNVVYFWWDWNRK